MRNVDRLLDIAKAMGIYIIARPGPYINAETDAGGYPGWLTNMKDPARSTAPEYTADYKQWLTQIDRILARHQLTNGTGTVILYQIENEFEYNGSTAMGRHYMQNIEAKVRADGITVPLTGNHDAAFKRGLGAVDIPGYDFYPQGLNCSDPEHWNRVRDFTKERRALIGSPLYFPEFQGGARSPWGGPSYALCRQLTGPDFERVFYEANIASGATMQNFYMTYGGTSWGWLAAPLVFTSYDYGAAIKFKDGDVVTSTLTTANQETVIVTHNVSLPRPYSLGFRCQGTNGLWQVDNNSIYLDGISPEHDKWESFDSYQKKYDSSLWKKYAKQTAASSGEGGMDFLMRNAFVESIKRKTSAPINVYDAATWSVIGPLSYESIAQGGAPVEIPDFTDGRWVFNQRIFTPEKLGY